MNSLSGSLSVTTINSSTPPRSSKSLHVLLLEDSDKMKSPDSMFFDLSGEIAGGITRTHYRNVTNVERTVFLQPDQYDAVGDEQEVVDNEGKNSNEPVAVKRIVADEELSGKQSQPREEDSLGQSNDLVQLARPSGPSKLETTATSRPTRGE